MLFLNFVFLLLSLFLVVKSADYCVRYSSRIAKFFHMSEFLVSFLIVAVISVLPEASIAILSALQGEPSFGMGTLLGSNVADLTLVFGIVALFSSKGIRVKSEFLTKDLFYLLLLLFPVVLGLDGSFSRVEGAALIFAGVFFFFTLSLESHVFQKKFNHAGNHSFLKNMLLLLLGVGALLISSHFALTFGVAFAHDASLAPVFIALTIVALGTCLPELFFSIRAVQKHHDSLALGDILGTVITDATIILGIIIVIQPFAFRPTLIHVTGLSMFLAGIFVISFISSRKMLTKKHGIILLLLYLLFLFAEFITTQMT